MIRTILKSFFLLFLTTGNICVASDNHGFELPQQAVGPYGRMSIFQLDQELQRVNKRLEYCEACYYDVFHYDVLGISCPHVTRRCMPYVMGITCCLALSRYFPLEQDCTAWAIGLAGAALTKVLHLSSEPEELVQERVLTEMRLKVLRERIEKLKQD